MILDKYTNIKISTRTLQHYKNKGYTCKVGEIIEVLINDLTKGTQVKIRVKCDVCGNEKEISYLAYNKNISKYPLYCCNTSCSKIKENKTKKDIYGDYETKRVIKMKKTNMERYGNENSSEIFRNEKGKDIFISEIINKYGHGVFNFNKTIYINNYTDIIVTCKKHGDFITKPKQFRGCIKCNKEKITKKYYNKWLLKSSKLYGEKFDYSKVIFKSMSKKVEIICPIHGSFFVTPNNHIKRNCSKCANINRRLKTISRIEENIKNGYQITPNYNKFACKIFDKMSKEKDIFIQHAMNGGELYIKELGYWVDGYDKENNTIYEYEPKHFDKNGNLLEKDINRQIEIEKLLECKFIRIKSQS